MSWCAGTNPSLFTPPHSISLFDTRFRLIHHFFHISPFFSFCQQQNRPLHEANQPLISSPMTTNIDTHSDTSANVFQDVILMSCESHKTTSTHSNTTCIYLLAYSTPITIKISTIWRRCALTPLNNWKKAIMHFTFQIEWAFDSSQHPEALIRIVHPLNNNPQTALFPHPTHIANVRHWEHHQHQTPPITRHSRHARTTPLNTIHPMLVEHWLEL